MKGYHRDLLCSKGSVRGIKRTNRGITGLSLGFKDQYGVLSRLWSLFGYPKY